MLKILTFIFFFFSLTILGIPAFILMNKNTNVLVSGKSDIWSVSFLLGLEAVLIVSFTFFWSIYLLTGYFNLNLTILFLATSIIGITLSAILWELFGSPATYWGPRTHLAGFEFRLRHSRISPLLFALTGIIFFICVALIGIEYFSNDPSSQISTIMIIRYTLIGLIFSNYPFSFGTIIGVFTSENIDEITHLRFLITQLGSTIHTALLIAMAFWAFGINNLNFPIEIGPIIVSAFPIPYLVLFSFFCLPFLIPYAIGTRSARRWTITLLEKRVKWVDTMISILNWPIASDYIPKLVEVQGKLQEENNHIFENDPLMIWIRDRSKDTETLVSQKEINWISYQKSRDFDPRFVYLDWICKLIGDITAIISGLTTISHDKEKETIAKEWGKSLGDEKIRIQDQIENIKRKRSIITASFIVVGGIIGSFILEKISGYLWTLLIQALPK
jgi:hypothetical protein